MTKRDDWLNATDSAIYLQVSRATFYRMLEDGRLKGIGTYSPGPRMTLYKFADLERWKANRQGVVGQEP